MKFFVGFFLGMLSGAAVAMILAPRRGDEVRESVAEMVERGKAIVEVARTTLDQAVDEGRRAADQQRESLESQVNR